MHGNAGCRLDALHHLPLVLGGGMTLFSFDFGGCGWSDGDFVSLGWWEREDLCEVLAHLRDSGTVSRVALWGRSMGAVTALLHAQRDASIAALVVDSPFSSLLMREYVVYHTDQAYPEYLIHFELR